MSDPIDKTKNLASKVSDMDTLINWLDKHKVFVRIGHATHSCDVSQFVDAGLAEVLKAHLGINLNRRRSELVAQLQAAASEV